MARQNTQLECVGAEFLVLGNLLIEGIAAYKSSTNMPGYDLIATNPEKNRTARIQVKSRWCTNADGLIIKTFEFDFVVIALLNRGRKDGSAPVQPPEYLVIPVEDARKFPRSEGWGKVLFSKAPDLASYRERWDLIRSFLGMPFSARGPEPGRS